MSTFIEGEKDSNAFRIYRNYQVICRNCGSSGFSIEFDRGVRHLTCTSCLTRLNNYSWKKLESSDEGYSYES